MENKKHKWYNEIVAFAEGKTIEVKVSDKDGLYRWVEVSEPNFGSAILEFRIKQEHKYIPFSFEDRDFLRGKWVRLKQNYTEIMIDTIATGHINGYRWADSIDKLEFIDGSPFGKIKEVQDD